MPDALAQDFRGMAQAIGLDLIFEDDFDHPELNQQKWFPYYLPHWSTPDASAARFHIDDSVLRLYVDKTQPVWWSGSEEIIKVSGIQTGHLSGPLAGPHGQHRFDENLRVKEVFPALQLFLPRYCRLEMKARARLNPWNLAALWLIGYEDAPERSGEITLFEAFGDKMQPSACRIGRGVKKINDPALHDEIDDSSLSINVEEWHVYAMDWRPSGITFSVDGQMVSVMEQSPDYRMQIMLNIYDIERGKLRHSGICAWFDIDYIRAYGMKCGGMCRAAGSASCRYGT